MAADPAWKEFFEQPGFSPQAFYWRDERWQIGLDRRGLPGGKLEVSKDKHGGPQHRWTIEVSEGGDVIKTAPDILESQLVGAAKPDLHNDTGKRRAIILVLTSDTCLLISSPAETFAADRRFPCFYDASGLRELAYYAPGPQPPGEGWTLALHADQGPPRAGLVVVGSSRGVFLLRIMPLNLA